MYNVNGTASFFVSGITLMLSMLACSKACKINIEKEFLHNEEGKAIDEQGKPIENLGVLDRFNALGLGVGATIIASFLVSAKDLYQDVYSTTDFIMATIIFGIIEVIFFVIGFYIVYGIMSAAKANDNDENARRNTAGWITIGLNLLLTFLSVGY